MTDPVKDFARWVIERVSPTPFSWEMVYGEDIIQEALHRGLISYTNSMRVLSPLLLDESEANVDATPPR